MEINTETYILKTDTSEAIFNRFKLVSLSFTVNNNKNIILNNSYEGKSFLLDGSYLMFPWVGRIESDEFLKELDVGLTSNYPFRDSNGLPLHGLLANLPRKIVSITESSITFRMEESNFTSLLFKFFPEITEKYTLLDNKLKIELEFENKSDKVQHFNFGYHPYFQFDLDLIENFKLESDLINKKWILDSKLSIPIIIDKSNQSLGNSYSIKKEDFIFKNCLISGSQFDNLFEINTDLVNDLFKKDTNYFELIKLKNEKNNLQIVLSSEIPKNSNLENFIPIKFIQIYSPEERNRIAIEPMSGPSNSFNIPELDYNLSINPQSNKFCNFQIGLKPIN